MTKRYSFKVKSCKQTKSLLWYKPDILTKKQKYKIAKIVKLQKRRRRHYSYIEKLNAKRKLVFLYGRLSKKTVKSLKNQAIKLKSDSIIGVGNKLLCLLERRLDSCLFRINFFRSFSEARQHINHGHILVNSRVVNLCSFMLKPGDVISVYFPSNIKHIENLSEDSSLLCKFQGYRAINSKIRERLIKKRVKVIPKKKLKKKFSHKKRKLKKRIFLKRKPQHLEISYKTLTAIYLYTPQQIQ